MKVKIVSQDARGFAAKVRRMGFDLVEEKPEVIIAHGGDGTFIGSERLYPELPKLGIRSDASCRKCPHHRDEAVLKRLREGGLERTRLLKLEGRWNGEKILAVNDIILRNADPRSAVRFTVLLGGQVVTEEMIGDGLVVCTPFGSSAYFRSITRTVIHTGIGIAFNNCTDPLHNLVVREEDEIGIEVMRGPATLAADNDHRTHVVDTGGKVSIRRARRPAIVLAIDTLRCPDCRYVNAPRRRY